MLTSADNKIKPYIIPALIFLAALSRVLPHPWNASPIAAMALFGGYAINNRFRSIALPLLAMLLSDVMLQLISHNGFYGVEQFYVYGSFILINIMGTRFHPGNSVKVAGLSVAGSLLFFAVTNFGTWLAYPQTYTHTLGGLTLCYLAGLPFLTGTILGDLFFNGVFYAVYAVVPGLKKSSSTSTSKA